MQMTNQPPTNTMKAATDMTEKQLISWEDLVEEIDKRGTELEDGKPDIYGENEGYTWGDVTC
jgi:hypothetical protein